MQTIIVRAMQKQQTRRFQQASEMLRALKNIDQMNLGYKNVSSESVLRRWCWQPVLQLVRTAAITVWNECAVSAKMSIC